MNSTCSTSSRESTPTLSDYTLAKGESFTTPEMVYTSLPRGRRRREPQPARLGAQLRRMAIAVRPRRCSTAGRGAYFTFDAKTLTDMIDDAADMGLEMFVLDDGWFGNKYPRNDANAGLGDWQVNVRKLPEGIDYIASHAHRKGLKFGIWIEPEMVNPKSELARNILTGSSGRGDREMPRMRNQWLLDLTNPKVQDFVFSVFDNTMKLSPNIDYIKWDANRHAENAGSEFLPKDRQSHFWIDYVQGFYKVMERIRAKYPDVLIQACASGGGRVEYGAMKYFNEVWTSDNTEALSRARIQYGTSLFYPATVMGSHVSATPNHQTSNITPIKFRFDMACAGRLGMELQPKQMNAEEKAFARKAIESYKGIPRHRHGGRPLPHRHALRRYGLLRGDVRVERQRKKAVLFTYCTLYQSRTLVPKFRLYGLDAQTRYKIRGAERRQETVLVRRRHLHRRIPQPCGHQSQSEQNLRQRRIRARSRIALPEGRSACSGKPAALLWPQAFRRPAKGWRSGRHKREKTAGTGPDGESETGRQKRKRMVGTKTDMETGPNSRSRNRRQEQQQTHKPNRKGTAETNGRRGNGRQKRAEKIPPSATAGVRFRKNGMTNRNRGSRQ